MGKARETLEIYAPLAHRLGIHAIKWELEDLAFQILHPRKYEEIKKLVSQQRDRARGLRQRGRRLPRAASCSTSGSRRRSPAAPSTSTRSTRR